MKGINLASIGKNSGFMAKMPVCENNYIINNVTWYDNFLKTRAKDGISAICNLQNYLLYLKEALYVRISS